MIVVSHIPLVTSVDQYAAPLDLKHHSVSVANAYDVLPLFDRINVLAVLQGHTHILERVDWHGVPYITGGAVSGNWWQGTRLGTPEGFPRGGRGRPVRCGRATKPLVFAASIRTTPDPSAVGGDRRHQAAASAPTTGVRPIGSTSCPALSDSTSAAAR